MQMVAKEQDFGDEAEDTLSLCDLVVSSDDANDYWDGSSSSKEDQSSSSDHDFFEFFSEDFSTNSYPADNIIFCGKLIPYKGAAAAVPEKRPQSPKGTACSGVQQIKPKKISRHTSGSFLLSWKSHSFHKSTRKTTSSDLSSSSKKQGKYCRKSLSLPLHGNYGSSSPRRKCGEKFDFSVKKVKILGTPVKSRWYLFAFGVGRFPMEMELRDMKMRQSRKNKAAMAAAQSSGDGGREMVKGNERRGKGLWRLLRLLGHANAMMKTSFGCISGV